MMRFEITEEGIDDCSNDEYLLKVLFPIEDSEDVIDIYINVKHLV